LPVAPDFPSYALAYLLKQYCSVTADKKYQLADWRVRPIPTEMLRYAREDTHYLLYIYDRLKNEAIARSATSQYNLLNAVLTRSRDLCLKKYEKDEFSDDSYLKLYNKYNVVFNQQQLRVFAALYNWRDKTARAEDESTRYVLPNHMLFNIAEHMPEEVCTSVTNSGFFKGAFY
jgi:exosome complex exonuclease RRP6